MFLTFNNINSINFFLQTLATSQGNILENKDLIESLNQTKASSALIQESLKESHRLQSFLDKVIIAFVILCYIYLNAFINMIDRTFRRR